MVSGSQDFDFIVCRIRQLEAQNRRLKALGIAILTFFSAIILMGQAGSSPRVLEAQKFVLKDSDGNVRGWIGTIGKGSEVILGNVNSQPMIRLIVSADAGDLHFFGSHKSGMNLGLDRGVPEISMIGADGAGDTRITYSDYGPSLILEDASGSSVILGTTQPAQSAAPQVHSHSTASLKLLNPEKKVIWQAP